MKYIVVKETNTDWFTTEHASKEEALKEAEYFWDRMSKYDKKATKSYYVLESDNPDEDADNHLDGKYVKKWK